MRAAVPGRHGLLAVRRATDGIELIAVGDSQHLRRLGILFPGLLFNTGHGINTANLPAYGAGLDNGPLDCVWEEVFVYGYDGGHYASTSSTARNPGIRKCALGRRGLQYMQLSTFGYYGNIMADDCYMSTFVCGPRTRPLARRRIGYARRGENRLLRLRWLAQLGVRCNREHRRAPAFLIPCSNSSQCRIAVTGSFDASYPIVFVGPDLESDVNGPIDHATGLVQAQTVAL